jgi:hypothetical protein
MFKVPLSKFPPLKIFNFVKVPAKLIDAVDKNIAVESVLPSVPCAAQKLFVESTKVNIIEPL